MIVLALDTAQGACSAAVLDGERVLAAGSEPMMRGHQERLAPMVQALMAQAGMAFSALDRVGVTVGPGSFTGLRVGLAFAKGLALALDIPCVGVGSLDALAASEPGGGPTVAAIDAKRGQLYLQAFEDGRALMAPDVLLVEDACARLAELWRGGPLRLVGSGAALLQPAAPGAAILPREAPDPVAIARLALACAAPVPPRPLYLRAPDAKPSVIKLVTARAAP
jgi:tRNA threonylcarbamoyladenosine biosynthesis protein TsaB